MVAMFYLMFKAMLVNIVLNNKEEFCKMTAIMADRPRLIIDCTNMIRRAVKLRAAREDSSASEVVMKAIRTCFPDEIREVERLMEEEKKRKKGRDADQS